MAYNSKKSRKYIKSKHNAEKNVKGEKVYFTFVFSYHFYVKILRYFVVINCCIFVFVFVLYY